MALPNCLLFALSITMALAIEIMICVSLVILQVINILGSFVMNLELCLKCDGRTASLCFTWTYFTNSKVVYNLK